MIYTHDKPDVIEESKLLHEIEQVMPVEHVVTIADDAVLIETASAMMEPDRVAMASAVDNHVGYAPLRIWDHVSLDPRTDRSWKPPTSVDFITAPDPSLYKHRERVRGELVSVRHCVDTAGSKPVVIERNEYIRDAIGFAQSRIRTISWVDITGYERPETKVMEKIYDEVESLREGIERRGWILYHVSMYIGMFLVMANPGEKPQDMLQVGRDFMKYHKLSMDMFVETSDPTILYDLIQDDIHPWLETVISSPDVTIRDFALSEIDIWGYVT